MGEQRRYSIDEIDSMRASLIALINPLPVTGVSYGGRGREEIAAEAEDRLRTHMLNGTDPKDLAAKASAEGHFIMYCR